MRTVFRFGLPAALLVFAAVVVHGAEAGGARGPRIVADRTDDPRMRVAIERLTEVVSDGASRKHEFVIGKDSAGPFLKADELNGLGRDGFVIRSVSRAGRRRILVAGEELQGTVYGVFRLARIALTAPARLRSIDLRMVPVAAIREEYEEHGWATPDEVPRYEALLRRYLEESLNVLDLPVGWFHAPPGYLAAEPKAPHEDFDTVRHVIDYAHSLGIRVYLTEDLYLNPLYHEPVENLRDLRPEQLEAMYAVSENGGREPLLLCLENPTARELVRRNREAIYSAFPDADGVLVYFGDPGGCWHEGCRPHGPKLIQYLNEITAPLVAKVNPRLEIAVTTWGMGSDDIAYVVDHIDELPHNVTAIQIAPTYMAPGRYMVFEPRRAHLIRRAARKLPVVIQEFHDGVGFHDSWVNLWEHPMARTIAEHFEACRPEPGTVFGTYGSSFEMMDQLVDVRIGAEWAWDPSRDPEDVLREYGDEQFGLGVGRRFAEAMLDMETYWDQEAWRFHFDVPALSGEERRELSDSSRRAAHALRALRSAEPKVVRQQQRYADLTDLAEVMAATAQTTLLFHEARRLADTLHGARAAALAEEALRHAERAVTVTEASPRYGRLLDHPWWKWWDIGRRPERIRRFLEDLREPPQWTPAPLDDPSFEARRWEHSGQGAFAYSEAAYSGRCAAELTAGPGARYAEMHPAQSLAPRPGVRYRVEFRAKLLSGSPHLYLDWFAPEADGENCFAAIAETAGWQRCRVDLGPAPATEATRVFLRFVACENEQALLIDDVVLLEAPVAPHSPAAPASGR